MDGKIKTKGRCTDAVYDPGALSTCLAFRCYLKRVVLQWKNRSTCNNGSLFAFLCFHLALNVRRGIRDNNYEISRHLRIGETSQWTRVNWCFAPFFPVLLFFSRQFSLLLLSTVAKTAQSGGNAADTISSAAFTMRSCFSQLCQSWHFSHLV